ncbi:MAG TPA: S1 RNA-binding domain-containing protein [Thermoanaerobaculia bacterium]|nr:S1 RNA-binding domain-containing protein [Thermoanaerobaculia bacterium]
MSDDRQILEAEETDAPTSPAADSAPASGSPEPGAPPDVQAAETAAPVSAGEADAPESGDAENADPMDETPMAVEVGGAGGAEGVQLTTEAAQPSENSPDELEREAVEPADAAADPTGIAAERLAGATESGDVTAESAAAAAEPAPAAPEPTTEAPEPTAEAPEPTAEAPDATAGAPEPTAEASEATAEAPEVGHLDTAAAAAEAATEHASPLAADTAEAAAVVAGTGGAAPTATDSAAPTADAPAAPPETATADDDDAEETPEDEAAAEAAAAEDPALAELRQAREQGTPVEGKVIGWNRGGFHVVVGEITAFCPSSEMELGRPKSPNTYVDRTLDFRVVKFQKRGRRVVLSRTALLTQEREQILQAITPGAVLQGRVTSLPDFGAFVDLGGVEGLVHVSEISRGRVAKPSDALKPGQEVEVKVLKVEKGGERISLSMKALEPDPWRAVGERFGRGEKFTGTVVRRTDFGLFVELEPEVEGLLHVSQLPPGASMDSEDYQPGKQIEGWVREVDTKRQRISLSLREVPSEDPWREAAKRFPEGEMVDGTVESIAPFGVFINLAPGLTGLLPNSQTGLPRGTNAARAFRPGQTVQVQVLQVDTRRKRISLGKEGSRVEASKTDVQEYRKRQKDTGGEGLSAMAAAFARLRGEDGE